ncbi:hypothetical protein NEFER03_0781 [Nematocida sp. LUAm3]|nr:hypothetical protein NEFER03_0781 [Nematocida sp. LUAm3]KAI5175240.1 hypothetical protein NEFER02_1201 [Nematocida sp. LUAm2]KAI5178088.1 hypothetical protein NEFER01_1266 [Nematocida sp. LUAm1]
MDMNSKERQYKWVWCFFLLFLFGCVAERISEEQVVEEIAKGIRTIFMIKQVDDDTTVEMFLIQRIKKIDSRYEIKMHNGSLITHPRIDTEIVENSKKTDAVLSLVRRIECYSVTFNSMNLDRNPAMLRIIMRLLIIIDASNIILLSQTETPFALVQLNTLDSVIAHVPASLTKPTNLSLNRCSSLDLPLIMRILKKRILARIEIMYFLGETINFLDQIFWASEFSIIIAISSENKKIDFSSLTKKQIELKKTMSFSCLSLELIGEESQLEEIPVGMDEFCLANENIVLKVKNSPLSAQESDSKLIYPEYSFLEKAIIFVVILGSFFLTNIFLWRISS